MVEQLYEKIPIRDAKQIWGTPTPERMWYFWRDFLLEQVRRKTIDEADAKILNENDIASAPILKAYISDNRWVADCPICNAGMAVLVGYGYSACLLCRLVYRIQMPSGIEMAQAVNALLKRAPQSRHWFPHKGETAVDLESQNMEHGI